MRPLAEEGVVGEVRRRRRPDGSRRRESRLWVTGGPGRPEGGTHYGVPGRGAPVVEARPRHREVGDLCSQTRRGDPECRSTHRQVRKQPVDTPEEQ